jgi:replicative DNA helicase
MSDLMPANPSRGRCGRTRSRKATPVKKPTAAKSPDEVFSSKEAAVAAVSTKRGRKHDREFTYLNADGSPVGVVLRWNKPNGKRLWILPVSRHPEGWFNKGMPAPRPLYRLPDLLSLPDGARVYVVEGEKAAEAARNIGLIATTSPHGAKSAGQADWTPLARKDVVIVTDNDEAGEKYANQVAALTKAAGADSVRIVRLPGLPEGGDIVEFIEHHRGDHEMSRSEIEKLVDAAHRLPVANPPSMGVVERAGETVGTGAGLLIGQNAMGHWQQEVESGIPPVRYHVGRNCLEQIEIGPETVALFGGAPGAGKTALIMQMSIDALRLNDDLRAVVCNVEMNASALLDRQLARVSGVDLRTIRQRQFTVPERSRIDQGIAALKPAIERLAFVMPPFDLEHIVECVESFGGVSWVVIDYVQRIGVGGDHESKRASMNVLMERIRELASRGVAVIVASAVGRTRDSKGRSSYTPDGLNLASFKETGELEYGADQAYVLAPDDDPASVVLRHLKSRNGELRDIELEFDGAHQSFRDPKATRTKGHKL